MRTKVALICTGDLSRPGTVVKVLMSLREPWVAALVIKENLFSGCIQLIFRLLLRVKAMHTTKKCVLCETTTFQSHGRRVKLTLTVGTSVGTGFRNSLLTSKRTRVFEM